MSSILLPSTRISQPPGLVSIDYARSNTTGMLPVWNALSPKVLSNGALGSEGNGAFSATNFGVGRKYASSTDFASFGNESGLFLPVSGNHSGFVIARIPSGSWKWAIEFGSGGERVAIGLVGTALGASVYGVTDMGIAGLTPVVGNDYAICFSSVRGVSFAVGAYDYSNKKLYWSVASAISPTTISTPTRIGSKLSSSSESWTGSEIYLAGGFKREISREQFLDLVVGKWPIYKKTHRRIYFDMGAASGGGTTYTDSFTESLTASDTHSQSAVFANAISEGLTAADSYLNNAVFADTLSYGITAGDALGHIQSILESLTETVMAGFTQSDSLTGGSGTTYNENITESLTAAYSVVDSATFVNALNEALTVSESLADNAVYSVLVNEALTAVSTFADSTPGETTLTAADLAAIAAIVQGIVDAGVNVTKLNGATLYGSGISSDKWRGTA